MKNNDSIARRRHFLRCVGTTSAVLALSELDVIDRLPRVSAAEANLDQQSVRFDDSIEPLVRLLEETPRERVVEVFADRIHGGTSYQSVLAALLLAGVRNVQPRPSVGFKFHAVLVVNSAHLASLASPDSDRWLPIFWALDNFKSAQASDVSEGDWTMAAVDESAVPPPHRARRAFRDAMEKWDVEAADAAVAGLTRTAGANEIFDLMAHYGCRDFRSIGHKSIFVANGFRTLQCIGWQYAEPVLRSLTYALLNHTGDPNPATSDLAADAAGRVTAKMVDELDDSWVNGTLQPQVALEHLDVLRTISPEEAVRETAALLRSGVHPQSIADALFLSAGEMLMQQPGIIALHSSTTTNAMQYAFRTAKNRSTRLRLLLQNAAFIPHFRESMKSRGAIADRRIDRFRESSTATERPTLDSLYATISKDRGQAAEEMLAFLNSGGSGEDLIHGARRLVFLKGNDSHDYKFSSAVMEDYRSVSPEFRDAYLASAAYLLPGSGDRDNGLVGRIQAALA
jgi:hypothetical protein